MPKLLTFCETTRFSKRLAKRLADDDYAKLQRYLAEIPDAGALIEGGGGFVSSASLCRDVAKAAASG